LSTKKRINERKKFIKIFYQHKCSMKSAKEPETRSRSGFQKTGQCKETYMLTRSGVETVLRGGHFRAGIDKLSFED
jgi:hypothetical protein